eukprot:517351-Amorphochlora_amoeboformis.AAC.2
MHPSPSAFPSAVFMPIPSVSIVTIGDIEQDGWISGLFVQTAERPGSCRITRGSAKPQFTAFLNLDRRGQDDRA